MRIFLLLNLTLLIARAQQPSFEVATIKPVQECRLVGQAPQVPGLFVLPCATAQASIVTAYVTFASGRSYEIDSIPVEGLPDWARKDMYTIQAKAEGNPSQAIMGGPMLQSLLAERFHLKIHEETREIPVYVLTLARSGSKLQPHREGSCMPWLPSTPFPEGTRFCSMRMGQRSATVYSLDLDGVDLGTLGKRLDTILDRPVIDKTGLAGLFDIKIEFSADDRTPSLYRPGQPADPSGVPGLSTAVQEQLGLRLESAKGPGKFLVVDHIERPSEN